MALEGALQTLYGNYTHANLFDLAAAVDAIPTLPTRPTEPVEDTRVDFPLRATGTTDVTPSTGPESSPLGLPALAAYEHSRASWCSE